MRYIVRHFTTFIYDHEVTESVMEARMQPRSDGLQRCLSFDLIVQPETRTFTYRDFLGNVVHHFDIPGRHTQLEIKSQAVVECLPEPSMVFQVDASVWDEIDRLVAEGEHWEMVQPSHFVVNSPLLLAFQAELAVRRGDPLSVLLEINRAVYGAFEYATDSTDVQSSIDVALESRRGVCQDFSHVMLAIVRNLGIPCRYVSGYLFNRAEDGHRSVPDASHAWVEAFIPHLGWVGFDPTNNLMTGDRHIRVAVGRDYADVPPTRGVCKGGASSRLSVAVDVALAPLPPLDRPAPTESFLPSTEPVLFPYESSQ